MATKQKPCTVGPRHKWDWVKDKTVKTGTIGMHSATMQISRKGVYKCICGELKYGEAKSGL
jgi:hypothetical protein